MRRHTVIVDDHVGQPSLPQIAPHSRLAIWGLAIVHPKTVFKPNRVVASRMVFPGWVLGDQFLVERGSIGICEWQDHDVDSIAEWLPDRVGRQEFGKTERRRGAGHLVSVMSPDDQEGRFA